MTAASEVAARLVRAHIADGGVRVFDFRHVDVRRLPVGQAGRGWARGVVRDPATVDAVLLHQWGVAVGTTPENRARHGEALALALRATEAPYHASVGATRDGVPVVALVHPVERHTFHAGPANGRSVGVGVFGRFPLAEGRRDVRRHGPAPGDVLRRALEWALAEVAGELAAAHGGAPPLLLTHRQAVSDPRPRARRSSDPGEWVVRVVCEAAARAVGEGERPLALRFVPDLTMGAHGEAWPAEWRRHLPTAADVALTATDPAAVEAAVADAHAALREAESWSAPPSAPAE